MAARRYVWRRSERRQLATYIAESAEDAGFDNRTEDVVNAIYGGAEADTIIGGSGGDGSEWNARGGSARNYLHGNGGGDTITGGDGGDGNRLGYGGDAYNFIFGQGGDDLLYGGNDGVNDGSYPGGWPARDAITSTVCAPDASARLHSRPASPCACACRVAMRLRGQLLSAAPQPCIQYLLTRTSWPRARGRWCGQRRDPRRRRLRSH